MSEGTWINADSGWKYELFEPNTDPSEFGGFESFLQIWRRKWHEDRFPARADVDLGDFKGWYGHVRIIEVLQEPFDLHVRLFGTEFVEIFQEEWTGRRLSEIASVDKHDWEFFKKFCDAPAIGRQSGPIKWQGREYKVIAMIHLPLVDETNAVRHVLSAIREK